MDRVMVIGSGGAGKTEAAREIATALGLPLVHLDRLFWRPGWVRTPTDEWHRVMENLVASDRWVIDGNYGGTMDTRLAAADAVVFLDVPRLRCLTRLVKRALMNRGRSRDDMTPGCPERLTVEFVRWVWRYPTNHRPGILNKLKRFESDGGRVVVLRTDNEIRAFLSGLAQTKEAPGSGA
jgi:adenylate kinase family enzyme